MKKFRSLIGLALVSALALLTVVPTVHAAGYIAIPSYIDGTTNLTLVGSTYLTNNTVLRASTNWYNLPGVANNTNCWTSLPMPPALNLQAFDKLGLQYGFTLTGAGNSNVTFKIAVSGDGSHWVTNGWAFTATQNGTTLVSGTNTLNTGAFPFTALLSIENPLTSQDVTGLYWIPVAKPGI